MTVWKIAVISEYANNKYQVVVSVSWSDDYIFYLNILDINLGVRLINKFTFTTHQSIDIVWGDSPVYII